MLQSFLVRHLSWCFTGTEHSVLNAFLEALWKADRRVCVWLGLGSLLCISFSAVAFSYVHYPDEWLMLATGAP